MKFPFNIALECKSLFRGYADNFPIGDYQWSADDNIIDRFFNNIKFPSGVLDAGCGPGVYLECLFSNNLKLSGEIIGFDFIFEMVLRANNEGRSKFAKFICADIKNMPFKPNSFGFILCTNNTLGNIPAENAEVSAQLRQNLLRILNDLTKPGGAFFLSVYNKAGLDLNQPYSSDRWIDNEYSDSSQGELFLWRRDINGNLARVYSHWFELKEVTDLLEQAGFSRIKTNVEDKHIRARGFKS